MQIDHLTIPVRDYEVGKRFYAEALEPLGYRVLLDWPDKRRVYLGIPANRSGAGKIHINMHDRLVELAALSSDEAIPSGTEVIVVDTQASDTVIVTPSQPLLREISNVE